VAGEVAYGTVEWAKVAGEVTEGWAKVAGEVTGGWAKVAGELLEEWTKVAGEVSEEWAKVAGDFDRKDDFVVIPASKFGYGVSFPNWNCLIGGCTSSSL
jgi:hypothetical protein